MMRTIRAGLLFSVLLLPALASAAQAQSARCRRTHAQAESRAYLLMSPSVMVQGLHVPSLAGGGTSGTGSMGLQSVPWQIRGGVSWSVLDVVRGAWLLESADTECRRQEARESLENTLAQGASYGRLPALRAEVEYLESQRPFVRELLVRAEQRRAEQLATEQQLATLRLRASTIERHIAERRAEIERLDQDEVGSRERPLRDDLVEYESASVSLEHEQSNMRRLDPWRVSLRLGVVPVQPVDWFGVLELSYNLGGIAQWSAEESAVDARVDELREADYEMRRRVEHFERTARSSVHEQTEALALLAAQIELVEHQRELLTRLTEQTGEMLHMLAMVEMNRIELEAERRFRERLLEGHRAVAGGDDGN